jgi:hypothetical protein
LLMYVFLSFMCFYENSYNGRLMSRGSCEVRKLHRVTTTTITVICRCVEMRFIRN